MKSKVFFFLGITLLLPSTLIAQKRSTYMESRVKSETVHEYFIEEGIKDPLVESVTSYDKSGNIIEYKEMNSDGIVKTWQKFKYNEDNDKIEETTLDPKGNQVEKIQWIYDGEFVVEKKYFDSRDRLTKRKEYKYTYYQE